MNTLHFSGSIVNHPDNSDSFNKRVAANLQKGRCVYKKDCLYCPAYIAAEVERQRVAGIVEKIKVKECKLYASPECPHNAISRQNGEQKKKFAITNKVRNQISDRGAWMYHNSENKLLFITLTLPPLKNKKIKDYELQTEINQAFSRFIENCKATYGLRRYLAVREGSANTKRYHFHVIMDIPFTSFVSLNSAWIHTIKHICYFSKNALTTDRKARFIRSISSATRYIAKYVSKAGKEEHDTRVFFCDRETAQAVVTTKIYDEIDDFRAAGFNFQGWKYNDYVCRYSLQDRKKADEFFYSAVQYLFGCVKKRKRKGAGLTFFPLE